MAKEKTLENSVRNLNRIFSENYLIMEIPDNQTMKIHKIQIPFIDSIVKAFEKGKQIKFKGEYNTNQAIAYVTIPLHLFSYITDIPGDIIFRRKIENPWNYIKDMIESFKITRYWGNLIINDEIYNLRGSYNKHGPLSPQTVAISKNY